MRKQRGVTMIGWIFLLIPMAIVMYAAIRVGPQYYDYYKLATAVAETAKQMESEEELTPETKIRGALQRRFDTGYIDDAKATDLDVTPNENGGWNIVLDYDTTVPLFGNLFLTMAFDKTISIDQPTN